MVNKNKKVISKELSIEIIHHNHHIVITYKNFKKVFIGYTLRESKRIFINDINKQLKKVRTIQ